MKFPGDEFLETIPEFRKRIKNSSSYVYVVHKTSHQEISRPKYGCAAMARKCTKKCATNLGNSASGFTSRSSFKNAATKRMVRLDEISSMVLR